jgi:hypothetical protein
MYKRAGATLRLFSLGLTYSNNQMAALAIFILSGSD